MTQEREWLQFDEPNSIEGDPWLLRLRWLLLTGLEWLWRRDHGDSSSEDTTCGLICRCGRSLWIGEGTISWCKGCGRGYQTRLTIRQYPAGLRPTVRSLRAALRENERSLARHDRWVASTMAEGDPHGIFRFGDSGRQFRLEEMALLKRAITDREGGLW